MFTCVNGSTLKNKKVFVCVNGSKTIEKEMNLSEEDFSILNSSSEDMRNTAGPSKGQANERTSGSEPQSQDKAAAGMNGCSFCNRSYKEKKNLNKHIFKAHLLEWEKM